MIHIMFSQGKASNFRVVKSVKESSGNVTVSGELLAAVVHASSKKENMLT